MSKQLNLFGKKAYIAMKSYQVMLKMEIMLKKICQYKVCQYLLSSMHIELLHKNFTCFTDIAARTIYFLKSSFYHYIENCCRKFHHALTDHHFNPSPCSGQLVIHWDET